MIQLRAKITVIEEDGSECIDASGTAFLMIYEGECGKGVRHDINNGELLGEVPDGCDIGFSSICIGEDRAGCEEERITVPDDGNVNVQFYRCYPNIVSSVVDNSGRRLDTFTIFQHWGDTYFHIPESIDFDCVRRMTTNTRPPVTIAIWPFCEFGAWVAAPGYSCEWLKLDQRRKLNINVILFPAGSAAIKFNDNFPEHALVAVWRRPVNGNSNGNSVKAYSKTWQAVAHRMIKNRAPIEFTNLAAGDYLLIALGGDTLGELAPVAILQFKVDVGETTHVVVGPNPEEAERELRRD